MAKSIQLSCGHALYYKTWLPEGDTLFCHECGEHVDVRVPPEMRVGQTYHPEYDCTTEPVPGKKGKYLSKCQRDGCPWERTANYHETMAGLHKHQANAHTRWGNPQLTLEGF